MIVFQLHLQFAGVLCLSIAAVGLLIRLSATLGLIERPGGRRVHLEPTAVVGGIGMTIALLIGWAIDARWRPDGAIASGTVAMAALGVWDDRHDISPRAKLLVQVLIVSLTVGSSGALLSTFGEIFPGVTLDTHPLALPITVFATLSVVNAVNMIDGVDGLAGSLLLVGFLGLASAAMLAGNVELSWALVAPAASLVGFLLFNLRPICGKQARTFMGDAGSMTLGFLLALFAILVTQPAAGRTGSVPPAVALWICAVPLLDGLSVILFRRSRGASLVSPGKDHLHHLLLERGVSIQGVVARLSGLAVTGAAGGILAWRAGLPESALVLGFLAVAFAWHAWTKRAWEVQARRSAANQVALVSDSR